MAADIKEWPSEQGSYLLFKEVADAKKTRTIKVSSTSGSVLGEIKWYSRWRCFAFFPYAQTLFNHGCLQDINKMIVALHKDRTERNLSDG